MTIRSALAIALIGLLAAWPLSAQLSQLRGRITDAAREPVPDQSVLLHRVIGERGASIGEASSDSAGRFTIAVDTAGAAEAVYFLATRWQGELYIGDPFSGAVDAVEHELQVGVPGTSASGLLEGTTTTPPPPGGGGGSPATGARWLLLVVPAASLLGVLAFYLLRGRASIPARRRLLARIAALDLEDSGRGEERYRQSRAELMAMLRGSPEP